MTIKTNNLSSKIGSQAFRGTLWAYSSFVGTSTLTFVSTLILSRLLLPADFGMMAYCLIAIQYLDTLNAFGSDSALIARRDKLEEASNATFVINILTGMLFYMTAWLIAPSVAAFFNAPAIIDMIRILALTLIISALASAPRALLQRQLSFRAKLMPDLGQGLVKGLCAIILALQGFGAWSLVLGQVAGALTSTFMFWLLVGWKPTLRFDHRVSREMVHYGSHMVLVSIIGMLLTNADYILVGRMMGAAALGYYTLAYRIPELLIRSIGQVFGQVALPILAQLQSNSEQLRQVYITYFHYISLCAYPIGVGIALTAPEFIVLLYTEKWLPSILPMQAISIAIAITVMGRISGTLYKAINRPGILNQLGIVKLVFAIPVLWYATRWGINGIAFAQIAVACFNFALDTFAVTRVVQIRTSEILHTLIPAIIASMMIAIVLLVAKSMASFNSLFGLLFLVVLGAVTYILSLAVISRDTIIQVKKLVQLAFL